MLISLPRLAALAAAFALTSFPGTASAYQKSPRAASGKAAYKSEYDSARGSKAFAQSAMSKWGWSGAHASPAEAREAALRACNAQVDAREPSCVVFDVDGDLQKDYFEEERQIVDRHAAIYIDGILRAVERVDRRAIAQYTDLLGRLARPPRASSGKAIDTYTRALTDLNSGRLDAALPALQEIAATQSGVEQYRFALGVALLRAGRNEEAIAELKAFVGIDRTSTPGWSALSLALARAGRHDDARAALLAAFDMAYPQDRPHVLASLKKAAAENDPAQKDNYAAIMPRLEANAAALDVPRTQRIADDPREEPPQAAADRTNEPVIDFGTCRKPAYPPAAQRAGAQGKVMLAFRLGADGSVIDTVITQSSGVRLLDETASDALERCRFAVPAVMRGSGAQIWSSVQYIWRLE